MTSGTPGRRLRPTTNARLVRCIEPDAACLGAVANAWAPGPVRRGHPAEERAAEETHTSMTIRHVGPTAFSFSSPNLQHSSSGRILSLARGADSARLYAGTFAGVWRSDDAGRTWRQLTRPQPAPGEFEVPGALFAPFVLDLAVSPLNPDLVLASGSAGQFVVSRDGIYRSVDGGHTWALVLQVVPPSGFVSQIVFAPDDATLVYAAVGTGVAVSRDAGATWRVRPVGGPVFHVAVAAREAQGRRRVYAAGNDRIFVSLDGGTTWRSDAGAATVRAALDEIWNRYVRVPPMAPPTFAGPTAQNSGSGAQILAIEPGNPRGLYLATVSGANGPSYYAPDTPDGTIVNVPPARGAGEASLWYGDFDQFEVSGAAAWVQLPGPPLYFGESTPSGNTYVVAKSTTSGYLLFFSDNSHVHVSAGRPAATASWHRLDGKDVSATRQGGQHGNILFMHVDPHALVLSGDLEMTLRPASGVSFPFDQNSVLDAHVRGTMWMANDGGVVWSEDGGRTWSRAIGLETIDAVNLAGLHGFGGAPALYMGTVDNDDFFTVDGGARWGDPLSACGDCDAWFSDVAQPTRVLEFHPRADRLFLITSPGFPVARYPDARSAPNTRAIPRPRASNASSGFVAQGHRPIVQTLAGEAPLADGDYVFVATNAAGERVLLRTRSIGTITAQAHWDDPLKAQPVGAALPAGASVAQASGGHQAPVFYVADPASGRLWKWEEAGGLWRQIVPGGPPGRTATVARRFFVDPYHPQVIYLLDVSAILVSLDGGESWLQDPSLNEAATAGGRLSLTPSILRDMVFVRGEPFTRFALGNAGVVCTTDGFQWRTVLSSFALPGRPEAAFFDPVSDPADRALYVACEGRGVLRVSPIGAPAVNPPPTFGFLELAAVVADA